VESPKSKVLHAIKSLFEKLGKQDEPLVSATTGIATKLIRGSTINSRCHFRKRARSNSDDDLDDLDDLDDAPISGDVENRWTHCRFLIIDEVSTLGCRKLFRIFRTLRRMKNRTLPFGGLFVLFSGDFEACEGHMSRQGNGIFLGGLWDLCQGKPGPQDSPISPPFFQVPQKRPAPPNAPQSPPAIASIGSVESFWRHLAK
jgi:PIF1-like helicase